MADTTAIKWHNLRPIGTPCMETHMAQDILRRADDWLTDEALGSACFDQMFLHWRQIDASTYAYLTAHDEETKPVEVRVIVDVDGAPDGHGIFVERVEVRRA